MDKVNEILGKSSENNPFLIPPEILENDENKYDGIYYLYR